VLPHRVLEEDLSLWRKDIYERMQPVIAGKTSVWEAVMAIHAWLMLGEDGKVPRTVLGPSEDRCKTPLQVMRIGSGGCGDLNMMMVYLLRAVGIPARHCLMCWRYAADQLHYYCEYWDPQLGRWVPLEGWSATEIRSTSYESILLVFGMFDLHDGLFPRGSSPRVA
jgi:transglutaminase-like putative cysteine protease